MKWNEIEKTTIDDIIVNYYKYDQMHIPMLVNKIWGDDSNINIIKNNCIKNKDILDIGAYIGTISLRLYDFSKKNNNKIYAFEPRYHECLLKNINDNSFGDIIKVHNIGLSNKTGFIEDHLNNSPDLRALGSQPIALYYDNNYNYIPINNQIINEKKNDNCFELKRLDDFNFSNIGFIKIDVESMEIEVLKGGIETLKNNNYPPILIECLGCLNDDPVKKCYDKHCFDVFKLLKELGYLCTSANDFTAGTGGDFLFLYK